MDAKTWNNYAKHYTNSNYVLQKPNKNIFSGDRRLNTSKKATQLLIFLVIISGFWMIFFKLVTGDMNSSYSMFAGFASTIMSSRKNGWGILEKLIK